MGCGGLDALLVASEDAIEDVGDGDKEAEDGGDGDVGSEDGVAEAEDWKVGDGGGGGGGEGGRGEEVEVDEGEEDEDEIGDGDHVGYREDDDDGEDVELPENPHPLLPYHGPPPSLHKGDSTHLVSLTSTTYGSLKTLDDPDPPLSTSSASAAAVISAWDLMDGLDDLPSPTTSSTAATKKPYFLPRSLTYQQEALLSSVTASATVRKRVMIPCNLGGSMERSISASRRWCWWCCWALRDSNSRKEEI